MRGRLPEITEGIGGGVEGLPARKQPVVERTELPGAQRAWEQTRDYNFKADPWLVFSTVRWQYHCLCVAVLQRMVNPRQSSCPTLQTPSVPINNC